MQEQIDTASPTSSFDFNDFTADATNSGYHFMENGDYVNSFLVPDVAMDLDVFADSFGWVSYDTNHKG